jgi:hypothetical protein
LAPGDYDWQLTGADGATVAEGRCTVSTAERRLAVDLPSGRMCRLLVRPRR